MAAFPGRVTKIHGEIYNLQVITMYLICEEFDPGRGVHFNYPVGERIWVIHFYNR